MTNEDSIHLNIVTYSDTAQAEKVLGALRKLRKRHAIDVITGVALVKKPEGKTEIIDVLDMDKRRGMRFGALAGGILTVLAPPAGIAALLAGTAAGAVTGRALSKKNKGEKRLTEDFLRQVMDGVRAGNSVLILLLEGENRQDVEQALAQFGGQIFSEPLTDATMSRLASAGPLSETPDATYTATVAEKVRNLIARNTNDEGPRFERVMVVINPASGRDQPILNALNTVFHTAGIDYDVAITKKAGDAQRLAREAAEAGYDVVAVYGGDGSVMEAASGLMGTAVPLAILPGGTNNVMSVELRVPGELVEAAALIAGAPVKIRAVDMGRANDQMFILRVGAGYEAVINQGATREMKDKYGGFAYSLAGLQALRNPPVAKYTLELDGETVEIEGLWCMVANSTSLGSEKLNLAHGADVSDGLLDVIVVGEADLSTLVSVAGSVANVKSVGKLPHWQVRKVSVTADPPQPVTGDGELWGPTPLTCEVIPGAVNILVPA